MLLLELSEVFDCWKLCIQSLAVPVLQDSQGLRLLFLLTCFHTRRLRVPTQVVIQVLRVDFLPTLEVNIAQVTLRVQDVMDGLKGVRTNHAWGTLVPVVLIIGLAI